MLHYIECLKNILADNFYRLQHLISPAHIAEVKKLTEPVAASDDKDADDAYFLDLELSRLIYDDINDALECFVIMIESDAPEHNPLN